MFTKLLIANRGEIACRIIRTARQLGIRTVAVFSEADAQARHVRLADEAILIGPAPARESYLDIGRILEAAKRAGAQAVHPGYGFLSENEQFALACEQAGLVFVGPPAKAIRAMGSKSAAKELMAKASVPLVPGYHGAKQGSVFLQAEAGKIGYPVLIKASAGGGGKGMRVVDQVGGFENALASCKREAAASFGDDRVLLEKYLVRPRHIEIQVFADRQGNCVHLFERDCSVQRRHQKVLEEAPAPGMTEARRREMGAAAIAAARAVGYVGAGTVEFIVEESGRFYFMEMNTRLQVEHPVTEMITGLDLVEWQLRVAAGEELPLKQEKLSIRGHAIEARVYAEDPGKGFLPSTGRLVHLAPPPESSHVRIDTGVDQGDEITPYYDPMIAKLVVWDADREAARKHLVAALAQYQIAGVANNLEFLSRLVASPSFATADLDTGLIERERGLLFAEAEEVSPEALLLAALATILEEGRSSKARALGRFDARSPWTLTDGWRLNSSAERSLIFREGDTERAIKVRYLEDDYLLTLDGVETLVRGELAEDSTIHAELGGHRLSAMVVTAGEKLHVFLNGRSYALFPANPPAFIGEGAGSAEGRLVAPMPGRVVALLVAPGIPVGKGTGLLVMESMKMELTIEAPVTGQVRAFHFAAGALVPEGAELLQFERTPS